MIQNGNEKIKIYWFTSHRTRGLFLREIKKIIDVADHDIVKKSLSTNQLIKLIQTIKYIHKKNITHLFIDSYSFRCFLLTIISMMLGGKVIVRVRGGMNNEYLDSLYNYNYMQKKIMNFIRNTTRNLILKKSFAIVPVSVFAKSQILYELPFIKSDKIHVIIKPTIRFSKYEKNYSAKNFLEKKNNINMITTVTSFIYFRKTEPVIYYCESIFKFLSDNKQWVWLIIGGGELLEDFKQKIKLIAHKYDVEHQVIFTGYIRNISDALLCTDIFFYPSFRDSASQAVKEAQTYGLPVIVNRSSCGPVEFIPPYTISQKQIFEEKDELESRLREFASSENIRKKIGQLNKIFSEENYRLDSAINKFINIL